MGRPSSTRLTRFPGAPDDVLTAQAVLSFASDGFLIGTAMRPHAGVGQSQAHWELATGVVSHTITFHEPFPADDWLLLSAPQSPPATAAAMRPGRRLHPRRRALVASPRPGRHAAPDARKGPNRG